MGHTTISLTIKTLSDFELRSYTPTPQYWALRNLLRKLSHTTPPSMAEEFGDRAKLIVIRIEFYNSSEVPVDIGFHNAACKAELLNLEICDDRGTKIPPVGRLHVRLQADSVVPNIVPAKGKYLYDLVGEVLEGWLVFSGAKFQLPQNGKLHARFTFNGCTSNTLRLEFS